MKLRRASPDRFWYGLLCVLLGLAFFVFTAYCVQSLGLGAPAARAAAGVLAAVLVLLAGALLWHEGCPQKILPPLLLASALAFFLRLLCLDYQSGDYNSFLAHWTAFFRDNGGFSALKYSIGDYNVPYLYFLAAISYLPIPDLYLIKLFSCLFDVLLAWGGLRLARRLCGEDSRAPFVCFCVLLFLPTVVLNGAYWGQCDSLYAALIVLAFSAVLEDRPITSIILLAAAFSFKLQTVFLIPLWCAFWFTGRVKFCHLLLFPAAYAVTILPALAFGRPLGDILKIYLNQTGTYSDLSLNSSSVFSFLPYGAQVDEALLSRLGILAAFLLVIALLVLLFLRRGQATPALFISGAVVLAIGVPFLLPHMHDRYFFLADVLTVVWACASWRRIPAALLVQASSLSCYHTYLALRYTLPFRLGSWYFTMALEALLMLAALAWSLTVLVRQWRACAAGREK